MVYDEIKTRAMFIKGSDRIKHPVVTMCVEHVSCDEWSDVLGVRVDKKRLYVEHAKRVRDSKCQRL